jgi:hypothetical protein|nr:MAG TPA: hypothetical protein [Caudoviricetes sp.]
MSNLEIREFSQAITNFVEASPLPEEVKRMALQENLARQEQKARDALLAEIADRDEAEVAKQEVKQDAESV